MIICVPVITAYTVSSSPYPPSSPPGFFGSELSIIVVSTLFVAFGTLLVNSLFVGYLPSYCTFSNSPVFTTSAIVNLYCSLLSAI